MLEQILRYLRNWFVGPEGVHSGDYSVIDGHIDLPFLLPGQHFRIIGSVLNDGVYPYDESLRLTDEDFNGQIWALSLPPALVSLSREVEQWTAQNGTPSPYVSESFAGYSYTRANGTWQSAFGERLRVWRKI